jgi:hypothetical protein
MFAADHCCVILLGKSCATLFTTGVQSILEVKVMPRSRPASNLVSYHRPTKQYYVPRAGKRIYLGCERGQAVKRYHEMGLGM